MEPPRRQGRQEFKKIRDALTQRRRGAEKIAFDFSAPLRLCVRSFFLAVLAVTILLFVGVNQSFAGSSARAELSARVPAAKLDNVPLGDAIDFLRDVAGVNINVDWKSLAAANITKETQINLNLHDVSAEKVLSLILTQAGPGDLLTYYIDQNVVEITTRLVADQQMITVVYYVEDLLQPNDTFDYNISSIGGGSAQVTGGGGGSGSSTLSGGQNTAAKTVDDKADQLIKLIETVVRPEIWRDNGGTASMAFLNGNLIVTAPRSVQEAIGGPVDR
jgi:hypothetical protein